MPFKRWVLLVLVVFIFAQIVLPSLLLAQNLSKDVTRLVWQAGSDDEETNSAKPTYRN